MALKIRDKNEAHAAPSGRVVSTSKGNPAFVPDPLPPAISFDLGLVELLSNADTALAELSASGRQLQNPHLLIAPYMRREAVLSSRIEGTHTNLSELLLGEMKESLGDEDSDTNEVRNYVRAMERGLALLPELPLSLRLVNEIHKELMQGVRGANKTPGEFRTGQNIVGSKGQDETEAPYVPPPTAEMHEALDAWEKYLNSNDRLPILIQCAVQHVQFESIHPYWDGNGRVGRLLIPLFLISKGRLSQPLLYLSAFIEEHRQDYYDLLQAVRTKSEWHPWLRFFLTGVMEIAGEAGKQAASLNLLREQYRAQLIKKPQALRLIDHLFFNPYITVGRAQRLLKVSQPTARAAVLLLKGEGILAAVSAKVWGRTYVAREILRAIDTRRHVKQAPPAIQTQTVA